MQDSIQLSDCDCENKSINILVSPQNNKFSKLKFASNTGSQQSLAYSNFTTLQKDNLTQRSPPLVNFSSFQKQNKKLVSQTRIRKDQRKQNFNQSESIFEKKQFQLKIGNQKRKQPTFIDPNERKTVDKNDLTKLARRNKQLEYALQLQTITSEELRSKMAVMSQTIQNKAKDLGLCQLLKMKNSSKDLKNVDIFIQMKTMRKNMNQKDVTIQRQKAQISKLKKQNQSLLKSVQSFKQRKLLLSTNRKQQYDSLEEQVADLRQEKQSLFNYIDQLKEQFETMRQHSHSIQQEIQRLKEKQNKIITIERPKFLHEITQKTKIIQNLEHQIMELKMSQNLMEANFQQQLQELKNKMNQNDCKSKSPSSSRKVSPIKSQKQNQIKSVQIQTIGLSENQIIKAQLNLLKSERDYYLSQYRKKIEQNAEIYQLKLKLNKLTP